MDTGSLKDSELNDPVNTSVAGPIALVGSGEYLEQMQEIETQLLTGRAPKYVQLATAAVPDGPDTLARWESMGLRQAERIGVQGVTIPVHTHDDANNDELVDMISGAGLIYLSGGHPDYLANTLRGTKVWAAILKEWSAGAALAGCSAGAMVMTSWIPSIRHPRNGGTDGLGLLPHVRVIPHFDAFSARVPDIVTRFVVPNNSSIVLGIDEKTALIGGPTHWTVAGQQSVWILSRTGREQFPAGSEVTTSPKVP